MGEQPIDLFSDLLKEACSAVCAGFEPDGDFEPTLFALVLDKEHPIDMLSLPGEMMNEGVLKDVLAQVITELLVRKRARAAALVTSAWQVKDELADLADRMGGSLEHVPGRTEICFLQVVDVGAVRLWAAEILRSETDPPRLGEWEPVPVATSDRFTTAMARALRPQG